MSKPEQPQGANHDHNTKNPAAAHQNVDKPESVLERTLEEFNPQTNEDRALIDNDVNLDAFESRIAELQGELKNAKEAQARANAEAYNAQRRMEQETEKSKKYALQKFATALLEVVDNLERAIENTQSDTEDAVVEGIKLTHKSLLAVLNKHGIEAVDPQNEAFDAELHEAVGVDPDAQPNQVGAVLQKGYTLNGRLLRPAMVRVGQ